MGAVLADHWTPEPACPVLCLGVCNHPQQLSTLDLTDALAPYRDAIARVSTEDEARALMRQMRAHARSLHSQKVHGGELPPTPLAQALELDPKFRSRPHLQYISERITDAVQRVEAGRNVMVKVSIGPRYGKTTILGWATPTWILRKHPDWSIAIVCNEQSLATLSGRAVRRTIESDPGLGVTIAPDAGAVTEWETTQKGGVLSRGMKGSLTGRGAKVLILDDMVKDFVTAHSEEQRQTVWDWWLSVAQTRLEPPYLVIAMGTRWHEDDFLGRLSSAEHEGDPRDWETIVIPSFAEEGDVLGRAPGEPLLSPLLDETIEEATERLEAVKRNLGTYVFAAMHQQNPAPAKGSIIDVGWFRYWTTNPDRVTDDGTVVLADPEELVSNRANRAIESWDMAFKDTKASDYVVGQRWVRAGVRRYLTTQVRDRLRFTLTVKAMQDWADYPLAHRIHERLVEDKANGTAVIDVLRDEIDALIPVNPTQSKEARMHSVTPDIEAGNVYLPHPADPGNEWVNDYIQEMREFPHGAHDDMADATSQALSRLRDPGESVLTIPRAAKGGNPIARGIAARPMPRRATGGGFRR